MLVELFEAQERCSEVPAPTGSWSRSRPRPEGPGLTYTFHAPLSRAACEALARATAARLGRRFGRDLTLAVADLGWSIRLPEDATLGADDIAPLLDPDRLADDVLEGLDRGDLLARRFRHVAATALMVLRNPEPGRRVRVGGLLWVSTRLYPAGPGRLPRPSPAPRDPPRGARRPARRPRGRALAGTAAGGPVPRLPGLSPFAAAWIDPASSEPLRFESPGDALRRLHARLTSAASESRRRGG